MPRVNNSPAACQARSVGIRSSWTARRKYIHTPETDTIIQRAYHSRNIYANKQAIAKAAEKLGWPKHAVTQRANELGLARTKENPWATEEERLLEIWGWMSLPRIAMKLRRHGFARTETAIHLKMRRLKVKAGLDGWSRRQLAEIFGVDDHKVGRWIKQGFLRAERTGITVGRNEKWFIGREQLRRFILNHPEEIRLERIDPGFTLTFLDIVSGGKLCEQWRKEAA